MQLNLVTFSDIVQAIMQAVGIQAADTNAEDKIKTLVNLYYLNEVVPFKNWQWLQKKTQIIHIPYYNTGTADVEQESTTVTLSVAPSVGLGSFAGYRFSVDSSSAVYTVSTHTAGSTTVVLTSAFQEVDNATASFKIWLDQYPLPVDARETVTVWHSELTKPLGAVGPQGFRQLEAMDPKYEYFPMNYNTYDFVDPTSGTPETADDRYRVIRLYPSITNTPLTVNVDYIQNVDAMEDDADEPLMAVTDRVVIYYGAGALAWSLLTRNEEMADKWEGKANAKLARMAGNREDGMDTPGVSPVSGYVNNIRRSGLRSWRRRSWDMW